MTHFSTDVSNASQDLYFAPQTRELNLCLFENRANVQPARLAKAWEVVKELLLEHQYRDNKDGWLFGAYKIRDEGKRCAADVVSYSMLVLDVDSKLAPTPLEMVSPHLDGYEYVVYSTYSHNPTNGAYCYRLVFPLLRDVAPSEMKRLHAEFDAIFPGVFDAAACSISQAFYLPSCPASRAGTKVASLNVGRWLDPDKNLELNPLPSTIGGRPNATGSANTNIVPFRLPQEVHDGEGRELAILKYAGALRARGTEESEILTACSAYNAASIKPPLDMRVVADRVGRYQKLDTKDESTERTPGSDNISITTDAWVVELNELYAVCSGDHLLYSIKTRRPVEAPRFRLLHDNRAIPLPANLGSKPRTVGAGTAWLKHPDRLLICGLALRPNEPIITADNYLNLWRGYSVTAAKGDIRPFVRLLIRLVPDRRTRRYLMRWLAFVIQNPGMKVNTAVVFWGPIHGSGKNLLIETVGSLLNPEHFAVIGQSQLESEFNGWMLDKVFVVGDEVSSLDRRGQINRLKLWVTGESLQINEKGVPLRTFKNTANFLFISNHADAVFLDDKDRRFFVHEVTAGRLTEAAADEFVNWRDRGGREALLHYLLRLRTDRKVFNPYAPAPDTVSKREMVEDSRSDLERWLVDFCSSDIAAALGRVIVTSSELARAYKAAAGAGAHLPSTSAVTKALKRLQLGFHRPNQVRLPDGKKVRAIALTDTSYWKEATEAAWAAELQKRLTHEVTIRTG